MLSLIWGILKIIGLVILAILGLLLTILLLVLFVPLRYELALSGEYDRESEEPPEYLVKARVSWLLRLICVRLYADETGMKMKVKLLGIPLGGRKRGQKSRRQRDSEEESETLALYEKLSEAEPSKMVSEGPEESEEPMADEEPKEPEGLAGEEAEEPEEAMAGEKAEEKKSPIRKMFEFFRKIFRNLSGFFHNLRCTVKKICDKIKGVFEMAGEIQDFLTAEENREALCYVKGEAGKVFRHILPQKFSGRVFFSLEDPAATGKVLAALGMAYPLFGKRLSVTPVFENKLYLEGSVFLKGRIRAFSLLIIGIRVWFNKKFRGLLKRGLGLKEQLSRA